MNLQETIRKIDPFILRRFNLDTFEKLLDQGKVYIFYDSSSLDEFKWKLIKATLENYHFYKFNTEIDISNDYFDDVIEGLVNAFDGKLKLMYNTLKKERGINILESIRRILSEKIENYKSVNPYIYDNPALVQMIENVIEPSSFICSYVTSAIKMLEGDKIRVYGFSTMENPNAEYFTEDYGDDSDEGHHFAVMNDRYIIDPWVYDNIGRSVFDLENKEDKDIIRYIYGDVNKWTDITNGVYNFKLLFPKTYQELIDFYKIYNMNLQESIRRILSEDVKIPIYILRRLDFSSVPDQMKEGALRNFNKNISLDMIIDSVSEYVASEIIPWWFEENEIPEEDLNNWSKSLKKYIFHKYGEETKEYVKRVLPNGVFNDDGYKYVFVKHSEQNGGSGFSGSFDTWGDLILGYGWWAQLDWNEIKSDLDKMDEGKKIILKPNDKHNNYGYYFSIIKKKSNLQESIKKTLREELLQIIDNNQQIKEGLPNRTKELILDKVKTMGFDAAASIVGGKDNLSKITGINTYEEYLNLFNDLTISPSKGKPKTTLYKNDKGINVFVHYYDADSNMCYVFINDSILQKPFSMDVIDHKPYHTKNSLTYEQKGRVLRKWLNDTYGIQVKNMDYLHNYYPGEENAGGYLEYLK